MLTMLCSWGLSLFVLFEPYDKLKWVALGSWGLSLFVLFEHMTADGSITPRSWGLSLFVLFELLVILKIVGIVLED